MGMRVFWKAPAIRAGLAICAAMALAFALAGCDNGASPGASPGVGEDQVVITVTNLSGDSWDGMDLHLVLERWVEDSWVTHAMGVATVQNGQAVFRMYAANADGNMTAQRFAAAGSFYLNIGNNQGFIAATIDMVSITTGSQSIALDTRWVG